MPPRSSLAPDAGKAAVRRARRARFRCERGVVAALTAIIMVVLVGMAGMAVDLGLWWQDQRHLQIQADAGALAGADELLQNPTTCPGNIKTVADQYAAPNSTTTGSDTVPPSVTPNGQRGKVTATTTVACPGSGSYVDVSMNNYDPGSVFAGISPTVSAHARVSVLQVGSAGGSQVLPYAITQTQAQNCCNTLVRLQVNAFNFINNTAASQSLVCDGSTNTTSGALMQLFEQNGCPTTQVSTSPTTCQTTAPPSCLAEFNGVDEAQYDVGLMRFNNNVAFGSIGIGPRGTCANANGQPVATNYSYQLPSLQQTDPRLITLFVVPDTFNGAPSFQYASNNSVHKIPIIGYASFYMAGWDHDPCLTASNPACPTSAAQAAPPPGTQCDPPDPGGPSVGSIYDTGAIWGYYVRNVMPSSSGATGTVPCNPNSSAASASCVAQMSQ
jgi:Flp pilus assembly protein TadG